MGSNGKLDLLRSVTKVLPHENDVKCLVNYFRSFRKSIPMIFSVNPKNRSHRQKRPFPRAVRTVFIPVQNRSCTNDLLVPYQWSSCHTCRDVLPLPSKGGYDATWRLGSPASGPPRRRWGWWGIFVFSLYTIYIDT